MALEHWEILNMPYRYDTGPRITRPHPKNRELKSPLQQARDTEDLF